MSPPVRRTRFRRHRFRGRVIKLARCSPDFALPAACSSPRRNPFRTMTLILVRFQSKGPPIATTKPVGDNARKGAVRKRTQLPTKTMGESTRTKRDKTTGKFMDQRRPPRKRSSGAGRGEKRGGES